MNRFTGGWLSFLVLALCLWNAYPLFVAWIYSPPEKLTWLAFVIWISPLIFARFSTNLYLLALALFFSILGTLGDLNTFNYFALALVLASFLPWNFFVLLWLVGSLTWMPLFGWIGAHYFPKFITLFRLSIALAVALLMIFKRGFYEK